MKELINKTGTLANRTGNNDVDSESIVTQGRTKGRRHSTATMDSVGSTLTRDNLSSHGLVVPNEKILGNDTNASQLKNKRRSTISHCHDLFEKVSDNDNDALKNWNKLKRSSVVVPVYHVPALLEVAQLADKFQNGNSGNQKVKPIRERRSSFAH